ncbi:MAG: S8 family serine peptidase [Nitrospinae bacterium]|nr:S8 family serine peptidase [Nitrospinota bacterium]
MGASLRLEGKVGLDPDRQKLKDLRGDAILYLWDEVDVDNALGYHDRNNRGIPYGFVFTELVREYGEEWSVTLSHEALELLADPEINLLVAGAHPNPEENGKEVFHWYEMCDAVQDQWYEIDGVKVSNFVLPLYFTRGDEEGSRNDFLGRIQEDGETLRSFGVTEGGYIGYYNPESGEHETYQKIGDKRAEERMRVRGKAKLTRRSERYKNVARKNKEDFAFECFTVELNSGIKDKKKPEKIIREIVNGNLGVNWKINEIDTLEFEVLPPAGSTLLAREVWDLANILKENTFVNWCEPMFEISHPEGIEDEQVEGLSSLKASSGSKSNSDLPFDWSPEFVNAPEAWALSPKPGGSQMGEGILIGHPDTGYRKHRETWSSEPGVAQRVRSDIDWDFIDGDHNAENDSGNHGLGTSSVIMSDDNRTERIKSVTGVAPKAELVPLRVSKSVILWKSSNNRLMKAIRYAREKGCHVISMSLGSILKSRSLQNEIQRAVNDGIIILAAAGNGLNSMIRPPVTYPAKYEEVIAVAACNIDKKPWKKSCRGKSVDITAPGEDVWKATVKKNGLDDVVQSSGTSFAVATTAGIAALWLAYHGRDNLINKCGKGNILKVFKNILITKGFVSSTHLDTSEFGVGIVNAKKVLEAPLPTASRRAATVTSKKETPMDFFRDLALSYSNDQGMTSASFKKSAAKVLNVDEKNLDKVINEHGDELAFHLLTDPQLLESFSKGFNIAKASKGGRSMNLTEKSGNVRNKLFAKGLSRNFLDKM